MARCSFSNAKLLSAFVVDTISFPLSRGYAATSQGVVSAKRVGGSIAKKGEEKEQKKNSAWVPDPKTGCYRPESHTNDIDVAELREALLKNKIRRH